jgi:hypothetical protein
LAKRNFFPELCSSPILAVNGSGMNPEDIPEYLGGSFRTNNSITCRHVEKFPKNKNKKIEEKIFVTKTQLLLNCLTILYFPIWNLSRLINYLTYVCWSCPCSLSSSAIMLPYKLGGYLLHLTGEVRGHII